MQPAYRHRQVSRPTVVSFIALTCVLAVPLWLAGPQSALLAAIAPAYALAAAVHWVLCSLTIEISGGELSWYFTGGLFRKRIALSAIASIERIRLPWWYGIGIKYTPRAWVYLVAAGDGVEIDTIEGKIVRIGSDDVEELIRIVRTTLPQRVVR